MSAHSQTDAPAVEQHDGESIVDATVVERPSTELAPVSSAPAAIIQGDQPTEILEKAGTIAASLADLIKKQNLSLRVGSKDHVEVGGWQALGALVGAMGGQPLHAETVWARRFDDRSWEACVEIRTITGAIVGRAEAMCSREESKWKDRDDFALRSMAETRAESRAYRRAVGWLVNIAGYSATPAEEMATEAPGGNNQGAEQLPYGPALTHEEAQAASRAVERIVLRMEVPGGPPAAERLWNKVKYRCSYVPKAVADAYLDLVRALDPEEAPV